MVAVNLTEPFFMSCAVLPTMLERPKGVIINSASTLSFSAAGWGSGVYSGEARGSGLTRQLPFEYGSKFAICPGATATPMEMADGASAPDMDAAIAQTPTGRWCQPKEVAKLASFPASDDTEFVHGSTYVIDGGGLTAARDAF